MEEIQTTVYRTADGREFTSKLKAEEHEKAIAARKDRTSYWILHYNPDCTEGRGLTTAAIFQVYVHESTYIDASEWMLDYVIRTYGRKIAYVQGVAPTNNWHLTRLDDLEHALRIFRNGKASSGIRHSSIKWQYLSIGDRETGLYVAQANLEEPPYVPANLAG